ncbi:MAG TPA: HipA N-terminal domain-containing protein [Alphaproteobacteria bacterium]|nr:HipA N-terminal domain-containing protein [Alphaproteobacteria bacterium]HQS93959.1 HipA N-terminal domain-containing protein [Alphaproteobacteria bacterium]
MFEKQDFSYKEIVAIDVFLEYFETRSYVGRLEKKDNEFYFSYQSSYLKEKSIISLGPEFPLTQKDFFSKELFKSLEDRIPDPDNPAYPSYCKEFGIPITLKNPLILLATIGRRGPSSFIFEPVYAKEFTFEHFEAFRKQLGLSLKDISLLFDVSLSSLNKIISKNSSGKDVLKRLEIYYLFKDVLKFQIQQNGKYLHSDKLQKLLEFVYEKNQ